MHDNSRSVLEIFWNLQANMRFRYLENRGRHQAITLSSVDLSCVQSSYTNLSAIPLEMPPTSTTKFNIRITFPKFYYNHPGAIEFTAIKYAKYTVCTYQWAHSILQRLKQPTPYRDTVMQKEAFSLRTHWMYVSKILGLACKNCNASEQS